MLFLGDTSRSIALLKEVVKTNDTNENAIRWIGILYLQTNKLDSCEKYYLRALEINADCENCYINLIRACAVKSDYAGALNYANKAISADPDNAEFYSIRAQVKEFAGDHQNALRDYDKAVQVDPKNTYYLIQRSIYYSKQGFYYFAERDIEKAMALEPGTPGHYYERARLKYEQQKYEEALMDMDVSLRLDSMNAGSYAARGMVFYVLKDWQNALRDYSRAIELDPTDFNHYYNRATSKYKMEDMNGSCADLRISYDLLMKYNPGNDYKEPIETSMHDFCDSSKPSYYYQRGVAFYNLGQYENAVTIYTRGLRQFPNNSMTLSFRGNAYIQTGEYQKAIDDYYASIVYADDNMMNDVQNNENFRDKSRDSMQHYVNGVISTNRSSIAEARFALRQYDKALLEIDSAMGIGKSLFPATETSFLNTRGTIYMALGKYPLAIKDFDACMELDPYYFAAYVNRALTRVMIAVPIQVSVSSVDFSNVDQAFKVNWSIKPNKISNSSDGSLFSALADCNAAITLRPNSDYAHYVRGNLKKILGEDDFCYDLLKARKLGYTVHPELFSGCKRKVRQWNISVSK